MQKPLYRFFSRRLGLAATTLLLAGLACAELPFMATPTPSAAKLTADILSTNVILTETALSVPPTEKPSRTPSPTYTVKPTKTVTLTDTPEPEATITPIRHRNIPDAPGDAKVTITDVNSQLTAANLYASDGDIYKTWGLLERPFNDKMLYRPDIDIQSANISSNGVFIYINIYLQDVNSDGGVLKGEYGVELDTDNDGRGDYLVWTKVPVSTDWSQESITVYADSNGDVGGATSLVSNAPDSSGDGFETILFSMPGASDPDGAWSRIAPGDPKVIQIAFKPSLLDKKTFLWWVWADDGLKDPGKFDYNDQYTFEEAGSPLKNNEYYPLKKLHSVDNTCRQGSEKRATGLEPGACGKSQGGTGGDFTRTPFLKTLTVMPTNIRKITPKP